MIFAVDLAIAPVTYGAAGELAIDIDDRSLAAAKRTLVSFANVRIDKTRRLRDRLRGRVRSGIFNRCHSSPSIRNRRLPA